METRSEIVTILKLLRKIEKETAAGSLFFYTIDYMFSIVFRLFGLISLQCDWI